MPSFANSSLLELIRLRLEFQVNDPLYFPAAKAANTLRGALLTEVPAPSPFVFRARHLNGRGFQPGEGFHFDLHLFAPLQQRITEAFAALAAQGFGPSRSKATLKSATSEEIRLSLAPDPSAPDEIRIEFLTPTELKHHNAIASRPEFPILFARVHQRIARLRGESSPIASDPESIGIERCEISRQRVERRSTRTGQVHSIGGFTGFAEYRGDFTEFLPYLKAAEWTGVGRHVVWGNGELKCIIGR